MNLLKAAAYTIGLNICIELDKVVALRESNYWVYVTLTSIITIVSAAAAASVIITLLVAFS